MRRDALVHEAVRLVTDMFGFAAGEAWSRAEAVEGPGRLGVAPDPTDAPATGSAGGVGAAASSVTAAVAGGFQLVSFYSALDLIVRSTVREHVHHGALLRGRACRPHVGWPLRGGGLCAMSLPASFDTLPSWHAGRGDVGAVLPWCPAPAAVAPPPPFPGPSPSPTPASPRFLSLSLLLPVSWWRRRGGCVCAG
jgi:hypothetical protein